MMLLEAALLTIIGAATPILLAATGELIVEKSGVLNLGVEGMMLMGAITGFAVGVSGAGHFVALTAAAAAGAGMGGLFAFLVLILRTNQVATGLALTIFGIGLSTLVGAGYTGIPAERLQAIHIPLLTDLPLIGSVVFGQNPLVYFSLAMIGAVTFFLYRTRAGLILRAVGENHDSAHAIGYPVRFVRLLAVLFGGAMAGLGGAYFSLVKTPHWAENMTAGMGWIALALIVFATWRPGRVLMGAYLFGAIAILELYAQAASVPVPSNFLTMLPYLVTIIILVVMSRDPAIMRRHSPGSIGKDFAPSG